MKLYTLLFATIMAPYLAMAQQDFSQQSKNKIAQLDMMVGTWEGKGYMQTPAGQDSSMVYETIQYRLDSTILFIEGKGLKTLADGSTEKVHDALGIISFHPFSKQYYMNSFLSKGLSTKANVEIKDANNLIWWFEAGPSTIRYSISIKDGQWIEIGERSTDGKNWQQFFKMKLKKTS